MNTVDWHQLSLRRSLLAVLLPGMLAVACAELVLTWRTAVDASNAAYDRSLLGAIKAIDANVSTASGGLGVELPYRLLEFFQLTASASVYYRIRTEDGLVDIGDAGLPPPASPLESRKPQFVDTAYFGTPVRLGSYAHLLDRPIGGQAQPQRIMIQVAETLDTRERFTRVLVLEALARDLILVLVAGLLLFGGVAWALRPLARLHGEVAARLPQDLTPISTHAMPTELRPLVHTINHHVERNRQLVEARRRFIDDASHQLRTPLTTLGTQVGFALRETDPAQIHRTLQAVKEQLDEAIRQTNQMLLLAHTDAAEVALEPIDLAILADEVTRRWWQEAHARGIDLGLKNTPGPATTQAHASLMREALINLLHNAIRYTPKGGEVTVCLVEADTVWRLGVIDNGPGIPESEWPRVGERFFRASNSIQPGSGLGLAIVRSIAGLHGGQLELATGLSGHGLAVWLVLPKDGPSSTPG